ncbi:hypothetical protein CRUP_015890 [Coryphaenoides rupestris]|nr:hypothetical protein CRUP_015890 [Coryphaenoides rupestris]
MDVDGTETPGTALTDVVRLLLELPKEQLLSLTYQPGGTPEEDIVHALSLLFLHKETQGLDRLQALQDNSLANHLAKKWCTAGGKLADFGEQCGHLDNVALEETLAHLARVFKVLSEKSIATTDARSSQGDDDNEKQTATAPSVRSKSPPATPKSPAPRTPVPIQTDTAKDTEEEEEEEEEVFYAFVILHAVEDVEMAEAMKETLESTCGGGLVGATFSADFSIPGKSSLRSIDDAIDNSAFTILLLTKHFASARRFQMETESALMNSIQQLHKYNTVIPLLPRENGARRAGLPKVLQTLNPLEENRNFERNVKRVLSTQRVRTQRKIWLGEQQVKKELRRHDRMKMANKQCKILGNMHATTAMLESESLRDNAEHMMHMQSMLHSIQCPSPGWQPQHVHVNNAKYIMIGNDSTMTVDFGVNDTMTSDAGRMKRTFIVPTITSFDHYDFTRAKIRCSLTWLVAKAFGSGKVVLVVVLVAVVVSTSAHDYS